MIVAVLALVSQPLALGASYLRDPWLGTAEHSTYQKLFWQWGIPASWIQSQSPTRARVFLLGIQHLSKDHLRIDPRTDAPKSPNQSSPFSDDLLQRWHAHASLLAAGWGDSLTLSPVSPLIQTVWVQKLVPPQERAEQHSNLKQMIEVENSSVPVVLLPFWSFGEKPIDAFILDHPSAMTPVNSSAFTSESDFRSCDQINFALIAPSISLSTIESIPPCAPDFSSGNQQTYGLKTDGLTPIALTDPWVLQTMLAGSLAHLIAIRPGLSPSTYLHALRATTRDYASRNWAFGTPQLQNAVGHLIHDSVQPFVALKPRQFNDVTLLLLSTSTDVQKVQLIEPPGFSDKSCRFSPTGAIRCVVPRTGTNTSPARVYKIKVNWMDGNNQQSRELTFPQ